MTQEEYDKLMEGGFCSFPFTNVRSQANSGYIPCCWSKRIKDADTREVKKEYLKYPNDTTPLGGWFEGDFQTHLRKVMLAGEVKNDAIASLYCSRCTDRENVQGESPRTLQTDIGIARRIRESFDDEGNMRKRNRIISFELNIWGVPCNLECYECNPEDSTTRKKRVKELVEDNLFLGDELGLKNKAKNVDIKKENKEQFYKIIKELVDNVDIIKKLSFCGGEPMLMTNHFELLDAIIATGHAKNIDLLYVSNMTLFTVEKMKKYLDAFNWVHIQWSVNGIGAINNYLRYPTDWDTTTANVRSVKSYLESAGIGEIRATFTPTVMSVPTIKETFEFLEAEGLKQRESNGKFMIYNRVENPKMLRVRNIPDEVKNRIADDVLSVSEAVYNDMMLPTENRGWDKAKMYLDALDKSRGTNWREVFPELAKY